ncbi:MAG: hypothetical protein ACLP1Q_10625 [Solirubrobacteraceae bacterium]
MPRAAVALAISVLLSCAAATPALAKAPTAQALAAYLKEDKALAYQYAAIEGSKLGVALPGGPAQFLEIVQSPDHTLPNANVGEAVAETNCRFSAGGPAADCTIIVSVSAHHTNEMRLTMAHEVFHAYEAVMSLSEANWTRSPKPNWELEGASTWVEADVVPGHYAFPGKERAAYFSDPSERLFDRDYDAIGFFDHMQSVGISPWTRFRAMFAAKTNAAAYTAALGGDQEFPETEASVFFGEASGWPWAERRAALPPAGSAYARPRSLAISASPEPTDLGVAPYANGIYHLSLKAMSKSMPVLEIVVKKGYARIRTTPGTEVDRYITGTLRVCSDATGCGCPSNPAGYPKFKKGDLALTGASTGADVELVPRKRCESLLSNRSCEGILPGFTTELSDSINSTADSVGAGKPFEKHEETGPDGYYTSSCIGLLKGSFVEYTAPPTTNSEGVEFPGQTQTLLDGVVANVNVTRYPTVEQATTAFKQGAVGIGGITTVHALGGIQEEAAAGTREITEEGGGFDGESAPVKNGLGQHEYLSVGYVRVRNVTVTVQLAGNEEADGEGIYGLLAVVSGQL